jgi:hypothetical protein
MRWVGECGPYHQVTWVDVVWLAETGAEISSPLFLFPRSFTLFGLGQAETTQAGLR